MTDLEFIKRFNSIKTTKICNKLKINRANLMNGITTQDNIHKVKESIINEVTELILDDTENTSTL